MNILVVADEESKSLWDYYEKSKLEDIDLILSCGDLSPSYLSFLVTMSKAPVLYVRGNHDDKYASALKIKFMSMRECAYWDLAVPCAISLATTSIQKRKCSTVSTGCVFSFSAAGDSIFF